MKNTIRELDLKTILWWSESQVPQIFPLPLKITTPSVMLAKETCAYLPTTVMVEVLCFTLPVKVALH